MKSKSETRAGKKSGARNYLILTLFVVALIFLLSSIGKNPQRGEAPVPPVAKHRAHAVKPANQPPPEQAAPEGPPLLGGNM